MIHPITIISGRTSSAICILDPTATPIDKSILSLQATVTAVACSAALPTIGIRINPTKVFEIVPVSVMGSIALTCARLVSVVHSSRHRIESHHILRAQRNQRSGNSQREYCYPDAKLRFFRFIFWIRYLHLLRVGAGHHFADLGDSAACGAFFNGHASLFDFLAGCIVDFRVGL